jgi:hypothetical protein
MEPTESRKGKVLNGKLFIQTESGWAEQKELIFLKKATLEVEYGTTKRTFRQILRISGEIPHAPNVIVKVMESEAAKDMHKRLQRKHR